MYLEVLRLNPKIAFPIQKSVLGPNTPSHLPYLFEATIDLLFVLVLSDFEEDWEGEVPKILSGDKVNFSRGNRSFFMYTSSA